MSEELLNKVTSWANAEEAVRVIIVEGSRARPEHAIDRFSDYDLNLFVADMTRLTQDDTWIAQLGRIWAMEKEAEPDGVFGRLVLFEGGQDIDFKLLPIHTLQEFVRRQVLPDDYHRGYTVLLDKEGITSQLPPPAYKAIPARKPSEDEFRYAVNVFWFELFHLVKYLHRDELWCVKVRDACIMRRLRQMIEWHAQACHDWKYDTWIVGKYMQAWVEPELWQAFFGIFARFDKADSWRAVCALMPLYQRLASETAQRLHYVDPGDIAQAVSEFILANSPVQSYSSNAA